MSQAKRLAGEKAVEFVEDGMVVGVGTGSTINHFIDLIAEKRLQVALGLDHALRPRKAPASGQTVDVRVHRERGYPKGLGDHHAGRFMAHGRQFFQKGDVPGHLPPVLIDQNLGKSVYSL